MKDNRFGLSNNPNEQPAASCGVSARDVEVCLKSVTPECFYRGSSSDPPGFPLKACGNDGLRKGNWLNAARCRVLLLLRETRLLTEQLEGPVLANRRAVGAL
jgi:hypothetical protein